MLIGKQDGDKKTGRILENRMEIRKHDANLEKDGDKKTGWRLELRMEINKQEGDQKTR